MKDKVIIDDVDVSKCKYLIRDSQNKSNSLCGDIFKSCRCEEIKDCYYKQLQKAKNYISDLEVENKKFANQLNEDNEKYCKITKEKYKLLDTNVKLKESLKAIEDNIMNIGQSDLSDYTKECLKSALRHIEESKEK